MKYFVPANWQLNEKGSLAFIKRGTPVVQIGKWGERLFFEIEDHNPSRTSTEIPQTFNVLLPFDAYNDTFQNVESVEIKTKNARSFHQKLFFEILLQGATEDVYNGYFYILKCQNFYKIGITKDYESRKQTYKTENPFPLKQIFAEKVYCANRIETYLKKIFKHQHHRGEWYILSERDLFFIKLALENLINHN